MIACWYLPTRSWSIARVQGISKLGQSENASRINSSCFSCLPNSFPFLDLSISFAKSEEDLPIFFNILLINFAESTTSYVFTYSSVPLYLIGTIRPSVSFCLAIVLGTVWLTNRLSSRALVMASSEWNIRDFPLKLEFFLLAVQSGLSNVSHSWMR